MTLTRVAYRIENPSTGVGLWYRKDGEQIDFIKSIKGAKCADLPMGYDSSIAEGGWISGTDSIRAMAEWLFASDAEQLTTAGHGLFKVTVAAPGFRITTAPYVHAVFRPDYVIDRMQIPFAALALS